MENNIPDFRNPQVAFESAISKGVFGVDLNSFLTEELAEKKFVGNWMYMHSDKTKKIDYFKNKNTRKYIEVAYE